MLQKINPQEAFEKINLGNGDVAFIDVRSSIEFLFVGRPTGAVHIAWIDEPDWEVNSNFTNDVRSYLRDKFEDRLEKTEIVLICRSGVRSVDAGNALIESGFKKVYSVDEGFEGNLDGYGHRSTIGGWRFRGLPWVQC